MILAREREREKKKRNRKKNQKREIMERLKVSLLFSSPSRLVADSDGGDSFFRFNP